jgi:hypothetical protein
LQNKNLHFKIKDDSLKAKKRLKKYLQLKIQWDVEDVAKIVRFWHFEEKHSQVSS